VYVSFPAQPLAIHTENAIELVRMVWGFITQEADDSGQAFSEQVFISVHHFCLKILQNLHSIANTSAAFSFQ
jgi:hypothetical protein